MYQYKIAKLLTILFVTIPFFFVDILMGSINIPLTDAFDILTGNTYNNQIFSKIIFEVRLPRAITACVAGAALATSGLQMQTLFRNPLAGPGVLGISSGASLGVAIIVFLLNGSMGIYTISQYGISVSWLMVLAAILGAITVTFLILLISLRLSNNVAILVIGMMIGNFATAIISIWQYFSAPEQIQDFLIWTFGSVGGVTGWQLIILTSNVILGLILSVFYIKPLNLMLLGDRYAQSMGVNIKQFRIGIILISSLLSGAVTGFCGPIGFIGIAVPHLGRELLKTSDHKLLIPACIGIGIIIMLICDLIAKLPGSSGSLPINAVTSLIGSPIVIWVILKGNKLIR